MSFSVFPPEDGRYRASFKLIQPEGGGFFATEDTPELALAVVRIKSTRGVVGPCIPVSVGAHTEVVQARRFKVPEEEVERLRRGVARKAVLLRISGHYAESCRDIEGTALLGVVLKVLDWDNKEWLRRLREAGLSAVRNDTHCESVWAYLLGHLERLLEEKEKNGDE